MVELKLGNIISRLRLDPDLRYQIPGRVFLPILLSKYSPFVLYNNV